MNALVAASKGIWTVKLYTNKILQFLTGVTSIKKAIKRLAGWLVDVSHLQELVCFGITVTCNITL